MRRVDRALDSLQALQQRLGDDPKLLSFSEPSMTGKMSRERVDRRLLSAPKDWVPAAAGTTEELRAYASLKERGDAGDSLGLAFPCVALDAA